MAAHRMILLVFILSTALLGFIDEPDQLLERVNDALLLARGRSGLPAIAQLAWHARCRAADDSVGPHN
jgi:hypothetical protein